MDESEFNDLSTDNTATSFDNSPKNTATSDELNAPSVYSEETTTEYAKSKRIAGGITTAIAILSIGVGGVSFLTSNYVSNPPTIADNELVLDEKTNDLSFHFTITNSEPYPITLEISLADKTIFSYDTTKEGKYEFTLATTKEKKDGYIKVYYTSADYNGTLWEEDFVTKSLVEENA